VGLPLLSDFGMGWITFHRNLGVDKDIGLIYENGLSQLKASDKSIDTIYWVDLGLGGQQGIYKWGMGVCSKQIKGGAGVFSRVRQGWTFFMLIFHKNVTPSH